jgi:hypothetical protein
MRYCKKILVALIFLLSLSGSKEARAGEKLSITIPAEAVQKTERISSIRATVTSGWIIALPKIPTGWSLCIENDPVWRTTLDGHVSIGIGAEYVEFFRDFMIIEKMEPERIPFNIEVEIVATADFEKEREIILKLKDLRLNKLKTKEKGKAGKKVNH